MIWLNFRRLSLVNDSRWDGGEEELDNKVGMEISWVQALVSKVESSEV